MAFEIETKSLARPSRDLGFSLLEMLASVAIIMMLMGTIFSFMFQAQKRFQGSLVISESNQTARAAMELMTQEIGQAGYNPQFTNTKTVASGVTPAPTGQCVTLSDIIGITPGDWLTVDSGPNYEVVQVLATSTGALPTSTKCGSSNQIRAVFLSYHDAAHGSAMPFPIGSYKFPYPSGMLRSRPVTWGTMNTTISNDHMLAFYGDINADKTIYYVVYSLFDPPSGPTTVTIPINGVSQTFHLYNLYRSITPVTFDITAANVNLKASPLVQNVIYQDINATYTAPATPLGPTGQPIFGYPNTLPVAITPSVVSVVGTLVINLCVAVNPKALESLSGVQWYTMATQIRPVNLWSAIAVNVTGGAKFLPQAPVGLPMAFPSSLSDYYF